MRHMPGKAIQHHMSDSEPTRGHVLPHYHGIEHWHVSCVHRLPSFKLCYVSVHAGHVELYGLDWRT